MREEFFCTDRRMATLRASQHIKDTETDVVRDTNDIKWSEIYLEFLRTNVVQKKTPIYLLQIFVALIAYN